MRNKSISVILFLMMISLFLNGCFLNIKKDKTVQSHIVGKEFTADNQFLESAGIGSSGTEQIQLKKRRKVSYKNALKMAQEQLKTIIMGLDLADGSRVKNFIAQNPNMQKHLKKIVKSARVVKKEWTRDGGCVVRLQIEKKLIEKKMGIDLR